MATIERCKVTSVGSRLVYGLDRDTAGTADRRVCFRRHDNVLISEDDVVLIRPWDWQDEKADVTWRYEKQEADQLREEGHIQEP